MSEKLTWYDTETEDGTPIMELPADLRGKYRHRGVFLNSHNVAAGKLKIVIKSDQGTIAYVDSEQVFN